MATEGALSFLQSWYLAQCNGVWEHGNGVTIETLATPGWVVTIDLLDTALEGRVMRELSAHRSAQEWILCKVEHNRFHGEGDPRSLEMILKVFQNWASQSQAVE